MKKENYTDEEFLDEVEQATKKPMDQYYGWFVKELAKRYLSERKQRADNPGVWDSAPKDAILAEVKYYGYSKYLQTSNPYIRTLPKTKAREIAEENASKYPTMDGFTTMSKETLTNAIERAILEYEKQTKGE